MEVHAPGLPSTRPPGRWPPPAGAPAGWYPDPYGQPLVRYFDGYQWTPDTAPRFRPLQVVPPTEHPRLPLPVVFGAVAILAVSLIGSRPLLDALIDRDWPVPVLMLASVVLGYAPSVLWMIYASRRWGTGRVAADLGVRFRWTDLAWGPLIWLTCLLAMGGSLLILEALDVPYRGNLDLSVVAAVPAGSIVADINRTAVVALVVSAVVVAPVVEEAIFRGAVLRGLLSAMPAAAAIGVQGVLFGAAHFNPDFGMESIGLMIVLSVAGIGFGLAAYLLRRIGPTIIAHGILNGVAVVVALVQAA
jgi:membrane protease YdiL (CAAX protease family)